MFSSTDTCKIVKVRAKHATGKGYLRYRVAIGQKHTTHASMGNKYGHVNVTSCDACFLRIHVRYRLQYDSHFCCGSKK